jgi:K+ transporter
MIIQIKEEEQSSVPVAVQLDHEFESNEIMRCIKDGVSAVMLTDLIWNMMIMWREQKRLLKKHIRLMWVSRLSWGHDHSKCTRYYPTI